MTGPDIQKNSRPLDWQTYIIKKELHYRKQGTGNTKAGIMQEPRRTKTDRKGRNFDEQQNVMER